MSKNFNLIYHLMIYYLPLNVNGLRGYSWNRTITVCATAYPCLKSFKFQVSSSKLFCFELFRFSTIHFPINCMNVCVVFNRNRVLVVFDLLILSFRYCGTSFWWRIRESNPWPSACKADALANWANPPVVKIRRSESWRLECNLHCCIFIFNSNILPL